MKFHTNIQKQQGANSTKDTSADFKSVLNHLTFGSKSLSVH